VSNISVLLYHYGAKRVPEGRGWRKMQCPFHSDKHASAGVNHEKEAFNCLGCDVTGNVYNIIQKVEGIGFREAKSRAEEIIGENLTPLPKEHRVSRKLSQQQGTISNRRKETSTGSSAPTSRRSRNV
jgi:DNA primase